MTHAGTVPFSFRGATLGLDRRIGVCEGARLAFARSRAKTTASYWRARLVFPEQDNKGNKGDKGKGKGRARAERERGWVGLVSTCFAETVHGPVFRVMWDG
jgi:hypothetical protein